MQNMTYALKERIGDTSLFCGRDREMELLTDWAENIPRQISKSRALLGRRKSGKTAIMQRLFNILWNRHGKVIPFYIEVLDNNQWLLDFSDEYFRTFISQYLSFVTRTVLLKDNVPWETDDLEDMAKNIGNENVLKAMETFRKYYEDEKVHNAMRWTFNAPALFTGLEDISVLVMIDEIQFMTKYIYWDRDQKVKAYNLPGTYHGLVESKNAPMLVSGSYVGWMTQMMRDMFKGGRLKRTPVSPKLTFDRGLEATYRYAEYYNAAVTDESAFVINLLTQADPFYIATLFRSDWQERDFSTVDGTVRTLAHEIKNREGEMFDTWSDYIDSTVREVNDTYAKKILLFLSGERFRECTRDEIRDHLNGELNDRELEEKLRTLVHGDLVARTVSNFRYSGIPDDILDLIFRELYQEEIDRVRPDIGSELTARIRKLEKEKKSLKGAHNELSGRMLEFTVHRELNKCSKEGKTVRNFRQRIRPVSDTAPAGEMEEMLASVCESKFDTVWMNYYIQLPEITAPQLDVLAEGSDIETCWALIFETKNRDEKNPPTMDEAKLFVTKTDMLRQQMKEKNKKIRFVCPVYLSAKGFDSDIEMWLHEQGVFTADMESWDVET